MAHSSKILGEMQPGGRFWEEVEKAFGRISTLHHPPPHLPTTMHQNNDTEDISIRT